MTTEIGIITILTGTATATADDGSQRILQIGDKVFSNDIISTGLAAGAVEIELADGSVMDLGRGSQVILDSEVFAPQLTTQDLTEVQDDVDALQQALLDGVDPTQVGEATAVGSTAESESNDGSTTVQISHNEQRVTPATEFVTTNTAAVAALNSDRLLDEIINLPPVVTAEVIGSDAVQVFEDDSIVTGIIDATDPNGDPLTFTLLDADPAGLIFNTDGSYSFDPSHEAYQSLAEGQELAPIVLGVRVTDSLGAFSDTTLTINVAGTNDSPIIEDISVVTGTATEAGSEDNGDVVAAIVASGQMESSDVDNDSTTTWSHSGSETATYGDFSIATNGAWTYTVDATSGSAADMLAENENYTETFEVTVTDDNGAVDTQTVSVLIKGTNDSPIAIQDHQITVVSKDWFGGGDHTNPWQTTGVEVDGVIHVIDSDAINGNTTIIDANRGIGVFQFDENWNLIENKGFDTWGDVNAEFDLKDYLDNINANGIVGIHVVIATSDSYYSSRHDYFTTQGLDALKSIGASALVDNPGGRTSYALVVEKTATGWNTIAEEFKIDGEIRLDITNQTTDENTAITIDVLANDTDVDKEDNPNTFSLDTVSTSDGGSVSVNGLNQLVFDPRTDFDYLAVGESATVVVNYTMSDDSGAVSSSTATIIVTGTNDAPTAEFASASGNEDTNIDVALSGTDEDGTVASFTIDILPENGTLMFGGIVLAIGGSVTASSNGATVTFLPNADWNGETSFTYSAVDNDGASSTAPAIANITVIPVPDGIAGDAVMVQEGPSSLISGDIFTGVSTATKVGAAAGFESVTVNNGTSIDEAGSVTAVKWTQRLNGLSNERDMPETSGSDSISVGTDFGTLAVNEDGTWSLTPKNFDYNENNWQYGFEDFSFLVKVVNADGNESDWIRQDVFINHEPDAVIDLEVTNEDATAVIIGNALTNDSDANNYESYTNRDDDGQVLSVVNSGVIQGAYGVLTLGSDGEYSYVLDNSIVQSLNATQNAIETFSYTVTDGVGGLDTNEIKITINGSIDAPKITEIVDGNTVAGILIDAADSVEVFVKDLSGNIISSSQAVINGLTWTGDVVKPSVGDYTITAISTDAHGNISISSNEVEFNIGSTYQNLNDATDKDNLVYDGAGSSTMTTGAGNDVFIVGRGHDAFNSGEGNDKFIINGTNKGTNTIQAGLGTDTLQGSTGNDHIGLRNFNASNSVEEIHGGTGTDTIKMGDGNHYHTSIGDFSSVSMSGIEKISGNRKCRYDYRKRKCHKLRRWFRS